MNLGTTKGNTKSVICKMGKVEKESLDRKKASKGETAKKVFLKF